MADGVLTSFAPQSPNIEKIYVKKRWQVEGEYVWNINKKTSDLASHCMLISYANAEVIMLNAESMIFFS